MDPDVSGMSQRLRERHTRVKRDATRMWANAQRDGRPASYKLNVVAEARSGG